MTAAAVSLQQRRILGKGTVIVQRVPSAASGCCVGDYLMPGQLCAAGQDAI
jgi:hypothetical protein